MLTYTDVYTLLHIYGKMRRQTCKVSTAVVKSVVVKSAYKARPDALIEVLLRVAFESPDVGEWYCLTAFCCALLLRETLLLALFFFFFFFFFFLAHSSQWALQACAAMRLLLHLVLAADGVHGQGPSASAQEQESLDAQVLSLSLALSPLSLLSLLSLSSLSLIFQTRRCSLYHFLFLSLSPPLSLLSLSLYYSSTIARLQRHVCVCVCVCSSIHMLTRPNVC